MIATATASQLKYTPRGAARALWHQAQRAKPPREILIEGPAGTGKTRALCEWTNDLCTKYPGIRVLWARFTLTSMRQSVQVTFEEKVLPPKAKLLRKGGSRKTRTSYDYPNGSEIVLGGPAAQRDHAHVLDRVRRHHRVRGCRDQPGHVGAHGSGQSELGLAVATAHR